MTPQIYRSDLVSDLEPPHAMCSAIGGSSSLRDAGRRQPMSLNQVIREANITWHGVRLNDPDWRPSSHSIAFTAWSARDGVLLHVILNAFWEPLVFELPKPPAEAHCIGGSMPSSTLRTKSPTGCRRRWSPTRPIARRRAPSSY